MKVLLIGSNFLVAHVLTSLMGFNNTHVVILSNKDPFGIQNVNNDVFRMFRRYLKNYKYADSFTGKEFGDPKRNIKVSLVFNDYINEPIIHEAIKDIDIIINCGGVYDSLYAQNNGKETLNVNSNGIYNILNALPSITSGKPLLIHMSSVNVYGVQKESKDDITEDDTIPNPQDLLNISLYNQENMIRGLANRLGTDYIILRLGTLIGYFTPISSLTNSCVAALLTRQKEFEVNNYKDSIELLDTQDLQSLMAALLILYQEGKLDKVKNQVFNVKSDEKEEKTVETIVRSIYEQAVEHLPQIGFDHFKQMGLKGMTGAVRLTAPKIKYGINSEEPKISFGGRAVSTAKAAELLKFGPAKPLVWSLLPTTGDYLLKYVLGDLSDNERAVYAKMLSLHNIPTPETINKDVVNKDVADLVGEVNKKIDESLS